MSSTATERFRVLVEEGRWAIAQRLLEHLHVDRMIVIDRARAAAVPQHAAARTAAAHALLADITRAGHGVPADPAAELVAAVTRRELDHLPALLAALRIPYGQRLSPTSPEPQPPPPRPRTHPPATPRALSRPSTPRVAAPADSLAEQVIVAIAPPRPPADAPLGPHSGHQTTAQRADGSLLELPDRFEDPEDRARIRTQCATGELCCPVVDCAAPALVLRAGTQVRPDFAHRPRTGVRHDPAEAWALRALALLQHAEERDPSDGDRPGGGAADRGAVRLLGPTGRPASVAGAELVLIATSHLHFAHRARLADGRWADLVELPDALSDTPTVRAVDHNATTVWRISASAPRRLRRGLHIDGLERLRTALRFR